MVPGLIASLTPIDVNAYDMESPELTANQVVADEFEAAEKPMDLRFQLEVMMRFSRPPQHHILLRMGR